MTADLLSFLSYLRSIKEPGTLPAKEFDSLLRTLRRNFPATAWSKLTNRGRLAIELHQRIDENDLPGIQDVLKDINSFSEDA